MVKCVPKPTTDITGNKGIGGRGGKSQKRAGTYFEYQTQKYFNNETSAAKRILGSGSLGKILREPNLLGDVRISFPILRQDLLADCKFGYSKGLNQLNLYKNWFEKISSEAGLTNKCPAVIVKFKGTRGPNSRIICFTWDAFLKMMSEIGDLVKSLEEPYQEEGE